jgi:cystathionine beta-lyase family protein involved in aluminum resistance
VFAEVFKSEDALVTPYLASGTHALSLMLRGILMPGDKLVSVSGGPYDTLNTVISGKNKGSLADYGISYEQIPLTSDGSFDYEAISKALKGVKVALITRSRGYEWRDAQSIDNIEKVIRLIRSIAPGVIIAVDNCYGEFIDTREPIEAGADITAGSLIKNAGGGIAPSGGYVAGKRELVEQCAYRLTAPGIGMEIGSYAYGYRLFYQGLFMAPSVVKSAIKTSMLMGEVFDTLGYPTLPAPGVKCSDIIRSVRFPDKASLITFCRSIQAVSPVDSYVTLEPWAMPGYECDVIMAAGTFVAGASIELSADSPIREPYIAYIQGALTYEHGKLATIRAAEELLKGA